MGRGITESWALQLPESPPPTAPSSPPHLRRRHGGPGRAGDLPGDTSDRGQVLEEEQMDFKLFLPLIDETARKVATLSPKQAQTGPMMRWDTGVMQMQMNLLSDERTRQIYKLMAESIHEDATK